MPSPVVALLFSAFVGIPVVFVAVSLLRALWLAATIEREPTIADDGVAHSALIDRLARGERDSLGAAQRVLEQVLKHPARFGEVFSALRSSKEDLRMRAAHVVELATRTHPGWLQPYKAELLGSLAQLDQADVQWRVALLVTRLDLSSDERKRAEGVLVRYLGEPEGLVTNAAMKALKELRA